MRLDRALRDGAALCGSGGGSATTLHRMVCAASSKGHFGLCACALPSFSDWTELRNYNNE